MAHHDALTELPNRLLLHERMGEMLSRLKRNGTGLRRPLHRHRQLQDGQRHARPPGRRPAAAGGRRAAARCAPPRGLVARLGGDEFAILQTDITQPSEVASLAARILGVLGEPFDLDGNMVTAGASIGIAIAPGDGDEADQLLKNADMALYRAKGEGKGTFRFFERGDGRARPRPPAARAGPARRAARRATSRCTTSRSSSSPPAPSPAARRWCAGATRRAAWCRRRSSSPSPRRPASSASSAPSC